MVISIVATLVLLAGGYVATRVFHIPLTTTHWIVISVIATVLLNLTFRKRG